MTCGVCLRMLAKDGKRDYCILNGCVAAYIYIYMLFMPMLLAIYAYAVGNMDVKSVDTLNYLLFHLRLGPPTFRPPLRLKFCFCFFLPNTLVSGSTVRSYLENGLTWL